MTQPGIIEVDHRGLGCEELLRQLPEAFVRYGDPVIRNSGAKRTTLEFGDVEWQGYQGTPYFIEVKLIGDFIRSVKSGHMEDQEQVLADLPGVKRVLIAGRIKPSDNPSVVHYKRDDNPLTGWTEENFPYSGFVNYVIHLEELGIDVIHVDSMEYMGQAVAAQYARSLRAPRGERVVKRRVVSVSNEANAVKALYPDLRLDAKACESIAKVAPPRLSLQFLNDLREKNGGKLLVKDVVDALPGVGRPTIRRIFGV